MCYVCALCFGCCCSVAGLCFGLCLVFCALVLVGYYVGCCFGVGVLVWLFFVLLTCLTVGFRWLIDYGGIAVVFV